MCVLETCYCFLGYFLPDENSDIGRGAVLNEDLLTFLPGETVLIRCDKPNQNFNTKLFSPCYLLKL